MKNVFRLTMLMILCISTSLITSCNSDDDDTPEAIKLEGTKWTFKAFDLGDDSTDALDGVTVNLEFKSEGKIGGSSGCNDYAGTYIVSGKSIAIEAETVTLIDCEQSINTQETKFITGLKESKKVEVEGNQLRLYEDDETLGLIFEKTTSEDN